MIQIFGTNKLFDTKSAERFFKERRMDFQFVDLKEKKMSAGEFDSVVSALARLEGGRTAAIEAMIDKKAAAGLLDEFYEQISFLYDNPFTFSECPIEALRKKRVQTLSF